MSNKKQTYKPRRKRGSYFSPLVSITLVLFLTGLFSILVVYADRLKDYLKENIQINIIFDDFARDADIVRLQNILENDRRVKETRYISKEEAKKIMMEELGENSIEILGFNPFPPSLEINFYHEYAMIDSIESFKEEMLAYPFVKEVSYQKVILDHIDKNVRIAGMIILAFMIMFLVIAIVLINNTVRLTMYSQRFIIKTMQMVGATKSFIIRPFIIRSISFGLLGGLLANLLVGIVLYGTDRQIPLEELGDVRVNILVAIGILVMGVFITGVSSYYSVTKYLKMKLDDLY